MRHVRRTEDLRPFPFSYHSCGRFHTSYLEEMRRFRPTVGPSFAVSILCVLGILPFFLNDCALHLLNMVSIYAIVAVGINVMTGYTGQLSLAHGALFGIGACVSALLSIRANVPFFLTIPISGVAATILGAIFAIPSFRLRPIYLPIATLAGQFILEYFLPHLLLLDGTSKALTLPKLSIAGLDLHSSFSVFYLNTVCLLFIMWLVDNLLRSKTGLAFLALRQNERAAAGMGIVVYQHKLLAFSISSFLAGIGGALFAFSTRALAPGFFDLTLSIEFLAIIVIGGFGTISGAIIGAGAIIFLRESMTLLNGYVTNSTMITFGNSAGVPIYEFVLGLAFVLFIIFKPEGLVGLWFRFKQAFNRWPFS